ncbi:hypothetical protein [Priestia megaterium]|uniref:hypothetical protein n=1 Tax=Priestia megaterium TaxID=1404 RepID=UPI000F200A9C|nr:hypothetical protein [Priestia megaterium]RMA90226.1 Ku70/Ku80-like protein [Priestia megaterium]
MIMLQNYGNEPYLFINDIKVDRDKIKMEYSSREIYIEIISNEVISEIKKIPFNKFHLEQESNNSVSIHFVSPWDIPGIKQRVSLFKEPEGKSIELFVDFSWELEKWKNIFSPEELMAEIKKVVTDRGNLGLNHDTEGYELSFVCETNQNIEGYLHICSRITKSAINQLIIENRASSLTSVFEFPEHVRVPCEQYLIYFAEFLDNLGISATTEITHEASTVLFTVIPESKEIALENIREALDIYIQLPSKVNNMGYVNVINDPQLQQLYANIQHLNSQMLLLNATNRMQDQTIKQQQNMIKQQQEMVDATILQTSLVAMSTSGKEEDKEELFGGTLVLTKLEWKGFELNLANIYRWIKNQFKKN